MTLNFEDEYGLSLPFEAESLAEHVIEHSLDYEKCPYEAEVNLLLTSNEEIHRMNREFRQIDRATDVLSFPMLEYEVPGALIRIRESCFWATL